MAHFFNEPSRTFSEYLLIPGYTSEECIPANVSLRTRSVSMQFMMSPAVRRAAPRGRHGAGAFW